MADVESGVQGNLTKSDVFDQKSPFTSMQFPVKINLTAPVAQEWLNTRRQNLKPWVKFAQVSKFQAPASVPLLGSRIIKNIDDFQSNYMCIFLVLIFYCLLTSPLLLFAVGASLGGCYLLSKRHQEKKLVVLGHELSLAQQYGLVSVFSFPLFYLAGAGAAVFWVLGASMFFIVLHASFYNSESPEDGFDLPIQQTV